MSKGKVDKVEVLSQKGGRLVLENPFGQADFSCDKAFERDGQYIILDLIEGEKAVFIR
jgi:hypothetical protein